MSESQDVILFNEALRRPEAERSAYLAAACAGDETLRQRVETLLRAFEQAGDFLDQPPPGAPPPPDDRTPPLETVGGRVGRYKLLQQIGEGGCGVVFMAEQNDAVRRFVALKVIKPGMDTKDVIARFEAERQALALMDHPNIARVFDAGATDTGRPYFVMELVRGLKITDYCDHESLSTEARVALFAQICGAIQHAHQKGVIHRDIKPSNILVTTAANGKPMPKVIDFGIAKATTGHRLTDKTLFTAFEMLIGTPAYMSPEQAEFASIDVDTRTDVYSLGVLLYELLTGTTPFDTQELLKAGLDEVRRVIRTQDPARPSTRLSTMMAADLTVVSHRRHTEPPRLIREIRGDLDWIVMKAIEKDRNRRYATAHGLALDAERFLNGEAVTARPPSALYKLQKLFLRNKILFIGLASIFLLLIIALVVTSRLLVLQRNALHLSDAMQLESAANAYLRENKPDQAENALRESIAIRSRYLNGRPPMPEAIGPVMQSLVVHKKIRIAEELLNQILTPAALADPAYVDLCTLRAEICARDGNWTAAARDAALLLGRQPENNYRYHMLVPLLVATTNLSAYREACSNIVIRFSQTTNPYIADPMAKDCLILPNGGVDLKPVAEMAKLAVTSGKGTGSYHFFQCCEALAEYRQGHFVEALDWATESAKNSFPQSQAEAYAVMAMAHFKLGNIEGARLALTNCNKVLEDRLPHYGAELGSDWRDWIIAHTLQKEADTLINRGKP